MTDPTLPPATTSTVGIPGQRSPADHPMRPELSAQQYDAVRAASYPTAPPPPVEDPYGAWGLRVVAVLFDVLLQVPFLVAEVIGVIVAFDGGGLDWVDRVGGGNTLVIHVAQMTTATWVGLAIAGLAGLGGAIFSIWNRIFRQGRRGASIGKQSMNLMVVSESDGRPIGAALTFLRQWAHVLDVCTLGIGYLWPLWDRKRQTFADMLMKTVVLHLPPLPSAPQLTSPRIPAQPTAPQGW